MAERVHISHVCAKSARADRAERERDEAREALRVYAMYHRCPGTFVGDGEDDTSGCVNPEGVVGDCPTCEAVADARNPTPTQERTP